MYFNTKSVIIVSRLLIFLLFTSCSRVPNIKPEVLIQSDGHYDFGFPSLNQDKTLNHISSSILKIGYIAYFRVYYFSEDQNITDHSLKNTSLDQLTNVIDVFTESGTGTATVLSSDSKQMMLITCAHIGNFPDTIRTYFPKILSNQPSESLYSVAIMLREQFHLPEISHRHDLVKIAFDLKSDLAIYGLAIDSDETIYAPPIQASFGKAKELEPGNFVYIIGYPVGMKMITSGLVSKSQRFNKESFLINTNFNFGMSGAPIFAIRDGVPNYEWIGLAKSVSGDSHWSFSPDEDHIEEGNTTHFPYDGPLFLEKRNTIKYGVTHTVPIESVQRFLDHNQQKILQEGFDF